MKINKKKYLKNPSVCPYCGSSDVSSEGYEPSGLFGVYDRVHCENCDASWFDVYKLVSVEPDYPPKCPHCNGDCPNGDDGCDQWKACGFEKEKSK